MGCLSVNLTRIGRGLKVRLSLICVPVELPALLLEPEYVVMGANGESVEAIVTTNAKWEVYGAEDI